MDKYAPGYFCIGIPLYIAIWVGAVWLAAQVGGNNLAICIGILFPIIPWLLSMVYYAFKGDPMF